MIKKFNEFINEEKEYKELCDFGCNYISTYLKKNPDIDGEKFTEYVCDHNKAGRDSGELQDICEKEIERLGKEFKKTNKVNEGFKVTEDDYNYFRRQIEGYFSGDRYELVLDLQENRNEWIQTLMRTARGHWELGDGKRNEFPEKEYFKVINEVIDEIINE